MSAKIVEIAGRRLSLSNLEKDLYPHHGFTKAHILEYYRGISDFMLPHLKDRAVTLKRYPDGVDQEFFFEKRCPSHRPAWVKTAEIHHKEERLTMCLVNDLETLMWVENLASLELHVPLARAGSPDTPDSVVFDLDPGDGANIVDCAKVALILRDLIANMRLVSCVKTSGKKGLHVYLPLNQGAATFETTKKFSKAVDEIVEKNYPDLVTSKMSKENRKKRVFINWSQNDASKTMVCVYSLRAREKPTISFPVEWKELEKVAGRGHQAELEITPSEAIGRTERNGDVFRTVLTKKQKLPYL